MTIGCSTSITSNQQAHELPVVDQCNQYNLTAERYGGIYDCTDGSWVLADSSCCEHPHSRL